MASLSWDGAGSPVAGPSWQRTDSPLCKDFNIHVSLLDLPGHRDPDVLHSQLMVTVLAGTLRPGLWMSLPDNPGAGAPPGPPPHPSPFSCRPACPLSLSFRRPPGQGLHRWGPCQGWGRHCHPVPQSQGGQWGGPQPRAASMRKRGVRVS